MACLIVGDIQDMELHSSFPWYLDNISSAQLLESTTDLSVRDGDKSKKHRKM